MSTAALDPQFRLDRGASHVFAHELRATTRTFLKWALPMSAFMLLVAALQSSMGSPDSVLAAKLSALPEGMRRALGLDHVDLTRASGYLATYFVYVSLVAGLWGATLGAGLVSKEEARRTSEMLYTQPISRERVLAGKTVAAALFAIAFSVVVGAAAIGGLAALGRGPLEAPLLVSMFVGSAAVSVCCAGVGMICAALLKNARSAPSAAMGLAVGTYLLGAVANADARAHALTYISPFQLVSASDVVARGSVHWLGVLALVAIGALTSAAAIIVYGRRDLHA